MYIYIYINLRGRPPHWKRNCYDFGANFGQPGIIRHTFGAQWDLLDSFWASFCHWGLPLYTFLHHLGNRGGTPDQRKAQLTANCADPRDLSNSGVHFLTYFSSIFDHFCGLRHFCQMALPCTREYRFGRKNGSGNIIFAYPAMAVKQTPLKTLTPTPPPTSSKTDGPSSDWSARLPLNSS